MPDVDGLLAIALELLLIAAAVGLVAKRIRVHYSIALVVAGVIVGASRMIPPVHLDPDVVLEIFLPILLFEAAMATDVVRLRENLAPVGLLAVPGMLISVGVAGAVLHHGLDLAWPTALLLGSILAATDTIAVIAGFRKVRAPLRLATIVENESLFNDGTALVAFTTLLAVVRSGRFDVGRGLGELVWVTVVGLGVGLVLGALAALLMRRIDDHLMEILVTVIVAYGASLGAERLHASPILAVVTAGIVLREVAWNDITATGKVAIRSFWEVAAFGVNSVVFLLVGLQVDFPALLQAAPAVGVGLLALTLGRAASIYPLLALLPRPLRIPLRWQHLLLWGNLKGSLSMALALSLPAALAGRESLTTIVFGCALVTLTVQGLSLTRFARAMGLGRAGEGERRLEEEQARLLAARAAQTELDRLQRLGVVPAAVFQRTRAAYQGVIARSEKEMRELLVLHSGEAARHTQALSRRLLTVEKSALQDAINAGFVREEVVAELMARIDRDLSEPAPDEGGK
jgi:CPA1 family monovalent cation:H+ antiporter